MIIYAKKPGENGPNGDTHLMIIYGAMIIYVPHIPDP
jgi:hypothetical protein